MAAIYNDGTVQYGSYVLTINSVAYIAESLNCSRPTKIIERLNELGEPNGQVVVRNFETGTAVLQLASGSTAWPTLGLTFTVTLESAFGSEVFIITEISHPYGQNDAKKVNISFRKKQA
ncbi:MAG: hypothetical protein FJW38_31105 [Acidobacteria bacterium]|nr:hypothetical protein [Acidobacteriota bacterium]